MKKFILLFSCLYFIWMVVPGQSGELIRWGNGWWYGNAAVSKLSNPVQQFAHIIFPTTTMDISKVGIYTAGSQAGAPVYHVGLQGNGIDNFPDGNWVGGATNYATTALSTANSWNMLVLPVTVNLAANTRYHIVVDLVIADAANYSSLRHMGQTEPVSFRPESGIYDSLVGREWYSGSAWSRGSANAFLAVDSTAMCAIGQPYMGATARYINGTTRQGERFILDVPGNYEKFYLRAMGMKVVVRSSPPDDCRLKLRRVSDNALLASIVLVDKDNLGGAATGITMTNLAASANVILNSGEQYRIYCESTNSTAANRYSVAGYWGVDTGVIPEGSNSTFQGRDAYSTYSFNEQTWYKYVYSATKEIDVSFELELEPIVPQGTCVIIK